MQVTRSILKQEAAHRRGVVRGQSYAGLAACAAGLAFAAFGTAPAEPAEWAAVVEWESGDSDVVETGTLADCMAALRNRRFARVAVSYCDRIGAKPLFVNPMTGKAADAPIAP